MPMLKDLILGTAGHIDHGKTSLIRALTGVNTDRLPEEKKRGITIELGYACLDLPPYRLGIVDVPGHEKFVRQMLAGATGMDLALLVVAADDSIKQQTREHLDILRLLDLPAGVIALTKSDLVEPEWLELVEEEVRDLVQQTFLADAPIVRTSARAGTGLEELKRALLQAAEQAAQSSRQLALEAPFTMAIDRTFAMEGHGTVVTGSVASGSVQVGDTLEIQPGGHTVRVRSLQNHDRAAEEVHRGQRAAMNLAGVHHLEVQRGDEVCAPGHLAPSRLISVELFLLHSVKKPLKDRTRVRFHIGTAELMGNVRLLEAAEIAPGESGLAQIYLSDPAVPTWNQPFVIRRESPVYTIGGGRILDPNATPLKKPGARTLAMLRQLLDPDEVRRAAANAYLRGTVWNPGELPRTTGVFQVDSVVDQLLQSGEMLEIQLSPTRSLRIHRDMFQELGERVVAALKRMHQSNPLRFRHPLQELERQFDYLNTPELIKAVISRLTRDKTVLVGRGAIGLAGYGPQLSKGERALLEQLIETLKGAGLEPPTAKALEQQAKKNRESVRQLLKLAADNGDLVQITSDYYLHASVFKDIQQTIAEGIRDQGGLTVSDIRQILNTSRKYAVPICEYLDQIGFTRRDGDRRVLVATNEPNTC